MAVGSWLLVVGCWPLATSSKIYFFISHSTCIISAVGRQLKLRLKLQKPLLFLCELRGKLLVHN